MDEQKPETTQKPHNEGTGRHKIDPQAGVKFTAENQPSSESKKKGWAKKKAGSDLAKALLGLKYNGPANSKLKAEIAAAFGVKEDAITVEMMMTLRQVEKSIAKNDTYAFNAIMDRAHGKPKQQMDITPVGNNALAGKTDEELAAILKLTMEKLNE
jgi:hypothetical protein